MKIWRFAGGDKRHGAMSDPGGSGGLERFRHNACRHCTMAGYYSRSPQPAENSASGIYSDPA